MIAFVLILFAHVGPMGDGNSNALATAEFTSGEGLRGCRRACQGALLGHHEGHQVHLRGQVSDSELLFKGPCADCGSSDACATYTDGHTHCFSCSKTRPGEGAPSRPARSPMGDDDYRPIQGDIQALKARGINEDTCRHFGYTVGLDPKTGRKVQLAPYTDEHGRIVAQKWRDSEKNFGVIGKLKNGLPLFGQHLWRDGGKKVVITEGEIDAMSVSQMQGNKWPVVSIPNGASGAKKSLGAALEWLEKFDEVILMFDQDDPGREAVAECAPLFTPGRCKVAKLPLKDANEMLKAGRGSEIIDAIWAAKGYRPDGIMSVDDLYEDAVKDLEPGIPWWLDTLTEWTYGRRPGECYAFGAGTGIGKTDWFTQSIAFDVRLGLKVGLLYLEQPPVETLRRIAGKMVGKPMHIPGKATVEERAQAIGDLRENDQLAFYNSFGSTSWEVVKAKIRYMVVGLGCKSIYLDHLTALVAGEEDERKALDLIMAEAAALALELGIYFHFISHLTRPGNGATPHEEGGRVKQAQFRGSNAIGMWSHFMFGLERNTQGEEEEDRLTTFRCLKDRNTGGATGNTLKLDYDRDTGLLFEAASHDQPSPFRDHSSTATKPEF